MSGGCDSCGDAGGGGTWASSLAAGVPATSSPVPGTRTGPGLVALVVAVVAAGDGPAAGRCFPAGKPPPFLFPTRSGGDLSTGRIPRSTPWVAATCQELLHQLSTPRSTGTPPARFPSVPTGCCAWTSGALQLGWLTLEGNGAPGDISVLLGSGPAAAARPVPRAPGPQGGSTQLHNICLRARDERSCRRVWELLSQPLPCQRLRAGEAACRRFGGRSPAGRSPTREEESVMNNTPGLASRDGISWREFC